MNESIKCPNCHESRYIKMLSTTVVTRERAYTCVNCGFDSSKPKASVIL